MFKFTNPFKILIAVFAVVILSAVGAFSLHAVLGWEGPTATPPYENLPAPLNTGSEFQQKAGSLRLGSLGLGMDPSEGYGLFATGSLGGIYAEGKNFFEELCLNNFCINDWSAITTVGLTGCETVSKKDNETKDNETSFTCPSGKVMTEVIEDNSHNITSVKCCSLKLGK